jgi:lipoate-protein ligase A
MIVDRLRGSATEFHARALPRPVQEAAVWLFTLERPALVLGSSQRDGVADVRIAQAHGVEVVRRNSGGGAVLLTPGRCLWVDVLLPRSDPRWVDDVGLSAHWLGDVWAKALSGLAVDGSVHRGRLERTPWGRLICFGAVGPGEVTVDGRKVVGISQRRTRDGARFQCLVLERWDPAALLELLDLAPTERTRALDELLDVATGAGVPLDALEAAFLAELQS